MTSRPEDQAARVIAALQNQGSTVATCESLTGGLICAALTSVPGASTVVRGALVTYAVDLKTRLAGVDPALIARHGVVSRPVALAMAQGAVQVCRSDWAIGVTGVAGPGPSDGVAAGHVWLAIIGPGYQRTDFLQIDGDRDQVRSQVVRDGLATLAEGLTLRQVSSTG